MKNTVRQIIITADDFGLCPAVNRGITDCIAAGGVTATCVMVNLADQAAVHSLRASFPGLSLGLHWNITHGQPLTPAELVPTLVDQAGSFLSQPVLRQRARRGLVDQHQLTRELQAQFDRFCAVAGPPDFWNSHQHMHVWPPLYGSFLQVAGQNRIRGMRSNRRVIVPLAMSRQAYLARRPVYALNCLYKTMQVMRARRLGFAMPRGMVYGPGYDIHTMIEGLLTSPRLHANATPAELMVHPAAAADPALMPDRVNEQLAECRILSDPGLRPRLEQHGVRLIGFRDLT